VTHVQLNKTKFWSPSLSNSGIKNFHQNSTYTHLINVNGCGMSAYENTWYKETTCMPIPIHSLTYNTKHYSGFSGASGDGLQELRNVLYKPAITFRPYSSADRNLTFRLLSFLPSLYPRGNEWLDHRLYQVLEGKARCTLALFDSRLIGVTIETPKTPSRLKLSTIYVAPRFRKLGVGATLLERCKENWLRKDLGHVHVTADLGRTGMLFPLLTRVGFNFTALEVDRYGAGRHEVVFSWKPSDK
jgi:GNAT superfamily N-acetyltransferase